MAEVKGKPVKVIYKVIRNNMHAYGIHLKTKDNQFICHRYQAGTCDGKKCSYAHICVKCDGPHPVTKCPELGLA